MQWSPKCHRQWVICSSSQVAESGPRTRLIECLTADEAEELPLLETPLCCSALYVVDAPRGCEDGGTGAHPVRGGVGEEALKGASLVTARAKSRRILPGSVRKVREFGRRGRERCPADF